MGIGVPKDPNDLRDLKDFRDLKAKIAPLQRH